MGIKIGNLDISKVYVGNTEVQKMYFGSTLVLDNSVVTPTNIVLNSTFDDGSNITFDFNGRWSVSGGQLNYNALADEEAVSLALSEDIVDGGEYDITFDVIPVGTCRFAIRVGGESGTVVAGNTVYSSGSNTVSYTHSGGSVNSLTLLGSNSAGGGEFNLDNVTVIKTN